MKIVKNTHYIFPFHFLSEQQSKPQRYQISQKTKNKTVNIHI